MDTLSGVMDEFARQGHRQHFCVATGTRGILVDAFGVYASPAFGAFLDNVGFNPVSTHEPVRLPRETEETS